MHSKWSKPSLTLKELAVFAMLAGLMYAVRVALSALPNIELVSVIIGSTAIAYREKAYWPVMTYVLLEGLLGGFSVWWIPYLYLWPLLCFLFLLLPAQSPPWAYMTVSALHGLLFGTLYAPVQALFYGMNLDAAISWILLGLPYDLIHAVSNFICGILIVPLGKLMLKLRMD